MPFSWWIKQGYAVKKGSKALKSVTIVEVTDDEGKVIRTFPRSVNLFHRKQVEPIHA
jgi:ribosomal protein L14E/L6E/L27E